MTAQNAKSDFVQHLFRQQGQPLLNYLTARFRDREDAAEIAQEAWLRIFRLDHPEALTNPRAFLFQTASNLAIDRLRRGGLEQKYQDQQRSHLDVVTPSVERDVSAQRTLATVEAALRELPHKCRQAFVMHRSHGLSYPQIASELGVSVSMVEKYIIKALKLFRSRLA